MAVTLRRLSVFGGAALCRPYPVTTQQGRHQVFSAAHFIEPHQQDANSIELASKSVRPKQIGTLALAPA